MRIADPLESQTRSPSVSESQTNQNGNVCQLLVWQCCTIQQEGCPSFFTNDGGDWLRNFVSTSIIKARKRVEIHSSSMALSNHCVCPKIAFNESGRGFMIKYQIRNNVVTLTVYAANMINLFSIQRHIFSDHTGTGDETADIGSPGTSSDISMGNGT
jgi:hypothetical protein